MGRPGKNQQRERLTPVALLVATSALLFLVAAPAAAQSTSCNTSYVIANVQRTFSTCLTLRPGMFLAWTLNKATGELSAVFKAQPEEAYGWISFGLSPNGQMVGGKALIGYGNVDDTSQSAAGLFDLNGKKSSDVVPTQSNILVGTPAIQVLAEGKKMELAFNLTLSTDQKSGTVWVIYAVGPAVNAADFAAQQFDSHSGTGRWAQQIDFNTGVAAAVVQAKDQQPYKTTHAFLSGFGWAVGMPIGILFARHCKRFADPAWFYTHIFLQLSSYIVGVVGFGYGIQLYIWNGMLYSTHFQLGIAILVSGTLQILTPIGKPDKASEIRLYWNILHWALGYSTVIMAIINAFEGFEILEDQKLSFPNWWDWKRAYGIFLICWACVFVILEALTWFLWSQERKDGDGEPLKGSDV